MANDNGNPPLSSSVNLNIRFYDPDSLPYFAENERLLEIQFTENETGLSESKEIYTASYNYGGDEEDWNFQVYYLLLEGDSEVFAVDLTTGAITLKQTLDREEQDQYQLRIIASNSETMPANYDEQSVLVVELKVTVNSVTILCFCNLNAGCDVTCSVCCHRQQSNMEIWF